MSTTTTTLDGIQDELRRFGSVAYLVTTTDSGAPHCVSVTVQATDDLLVVAPGNQSLANASRHDRVTLLWPPKRWGEHSLIIDGQVQSATGTGHGDNRITLRPTRAVLHPTINPGDGLPTPSGCVLLYERSNAAG